MFKRMVIGSGIALLLGAVVLGTGLRSHVRTAGSWMKEAARDSMSLEWELKRARQMVLDLEPEITKNARLIAREKIEVTRLQSQLDDQESRLGSAQRDILRLSEDLRSGKDRFVYGNRTYTSHQVHNDLESRFKRLKTRQATAEQLRQMLSAREASMRSAEERMDAMLTAKQQLEVEIENLQARLGALRVAQTSSQLNLDDSRLARTRELLDEIATRIHVEEEVVHVDASYFGEINLEETSSADILEEISDYFAQQGMNSEGSEGTHGERLTRSGR